MTTNSPDLSQDPRLDKLAEIAVKTGAGLQVGQELVMTAPIEAAALARKITEHAYRAGASLVTTLFSDDASTLARFAHGRDDCFDKAAGWLFQGMADAYKSGAARLAISGENPSLLSGQDTDKVARANRARSIAYRPALDYIVNFEINWTIVSCATPAWAKLVFPNASEDAAMQKLWDAIFAASRADVDDPVAAWAAHDKNLKSRMNYLNDARFHTLHFKGPGTDLKVGLADDHWWQGGSSVAKNGATCQANIPTEEVFTTPHRARVDGTVRASKPLSYQGTLIEEIAVKFEDGAIVSSHARTGADVLAKVLDTDEGARRLGEVALVPWSSPISKSGILFYNTLFDENAASHIALGQSYTKCVRDGDKLDAKALLAKGANASLIHIDWMIGSKDVDLDGLDAKGGATPLMRKGEWV
jgi:aminopeptidase